MFSKIKTKHNHTIEYKVSSHQNIQIYDKIKKYRLQVASERKRFGPIDATTGFTVKLIDSIVEKCEYLTSADEFCQIFPIWEEAHAKVVFDVISQVCSS